MVTSTPAAVLSVPIMEATPEECCVLEETREEEVSQLFTMKGSLHGTPIRILLDSGASCNFVNSDFVCKNKIPICTTNRDGIVKLANGESTGVLGSVELPIRIGDHCGISNFKVIPLTVKYQIVFGKPWLVKLNPMIDWQKGYLEIREKGISYKLYSENAAGQCQSEQNSGVISKNVVCRDFENGVTRVRKREHQEGNFNYRGTKTGEKGSLDATKAIDHSRFRKESLNSGGSKSLPTSPT